MTLSQEEGFLRKRVYQHWPLLALSGFFFLLCFYVFFSVPPTSIQNTLLPGSYLPLIILVILAVGFLSSFLLLHTRRGFLIGIGFGLLLLLRLQHKVDIYMILSVSVGLLCIEGCLTIWRKK